MCRLLGLIFVVFFQIACNTSQSDNIILFNNIEFEVREGEYIQQPDGMLTSLYLDIIAPKGLQIPMYKCLKNADFTCFIGLPLQTELGILADAPLLFAGQPIQNLFTEGESMYRAYLVNQVYYIEYASVLGENLIYIIVSTKEERVFKELFTSQSLDARIKTV